MLELFFIVHKGKNNVHFEYARIINGKSHLCFLLAFYFMYMLFFSESFS